jgi:hypothetical protein
MKGMSSFLSGSSNYWKGTFSNLGKGFCCDQPEDMIVESVDANISNIHTKTGNIHDIDKKKSIKIN